MMHDVTLTDSYLLVSIIVPCRNEIDYIDQFVSNVFRQRVNNFDLEVIVADGESDDGTRERLSELVKSNNKIFLLDNPLRIVSSGLNLAIAKARGEIVIRMDVHTRYSEDYVMRCVQSLRETGAVCVGGPWVAEGSLPIQRAIAAAFQSKIGSGGAASRRADFSGWVDTVYLGAWKRSDLLCLGGFDEALVRNQDDELCLRIRRQGGRIWQSSAIHSYYVPRPSLVALYHQFRQYGFWKIPVIRKHRLPASVRHLVPFGFISLLALLSFPALFWMPVRLAFFSLIFAYLGTLIVGTRREREAFDTPQLSFLTISAVATMHFGYAVGFGRALWVFCVRRKDGNDRMTQLTR